MRVVRAMILLCAGLPFLTAQTSAREFWPEIDLFIQNGERIRFVIQPAGTLAPETGVRQANITFSVEVALRPLVRIELRHRNDVFRRRFLTFRVGYRRVDNFNNGGPEDRGIAELNARYALPGKLVLSDRNRGEFRFVHGRPFAMRYRNRIGIERDLAIGNFKFTPEAFNEYFYDTRYGTLSRVQYRAGLLVPIGRHVVAEPYVAWQVNKTSAQRHTGALGFKLNLYF
jgi:hypothetical protein